MAKQTDTDTDRGDTDRGGNSNRDLASILEGYVKLSDHNDLLDAFSALEAENGTLKEQLGTFEGIDLKEHAKAAKRLQELEAKVRTRNHRDAFDALAKKLRIDDDFKDDVFDLAKLTSDKDEPDAKVMESTLKEWLDARESRKKYLLPEETEEATGAQPETKGKEGPPAKPKLAVNEDEGRGGPTTGSKKIRYREGDLSNPEWMRVNGVAYAKAVQSGDAVKIA